MPDMHLTADSVSLVIDPERGGRLSSLEVAGLELLVIEPTADSLQWGSYPMVPWAGRIREGLFAHGGIAHQMPCNLPPHSAHGLGFVSEWSIVASEPSEATIALDLGPPWPFGGQVTQHLALTENDLIITMTITAETDMPVMLGWHPWFARYVQPKVQPAGPEPEPELEPVEAELRFEPGLMYELDDASIPTGQLVSPPPGPWDNCFTSLANSPTIRWPGLLTLDLDSSCDHWVVYTQPDHALCVEPQSGPPDQFNRNPLIIEEGQSHEAWFRLSWK